VKLIASPEVGELIRRQGGRLYVWPRSARCCAHGLAWLETGPKARSGWRYDSVHAEGYELYLARMARVPEELHLKVSGWRRKRVSAYWDNCAYVI